MGEGRAMGFFARVTKGGKITIPVEIRRLLGINRGDMVEVTGVRKLEQGEAR